MEFQTYFYGGEAEQDSPEAARLRRLVASPAAGRVMGLVADSPPGQWSRGELEARFGPELVDGLLLAGTLREENGGVWLDCPVFLEGDLEPLRRLTGRRAEEIASRLRPLQGRMEELMAALPNGVPPGENLYHLLCGGVFDGRYFDALEGEGLAAVRRDRALPDVVTLYQRGTALERWSRSLLCSYNRYGTPAGIFQSFGDCAGDRWDFYRVARQLETGALEDTALIPLSRKALVEAYLALAAGKPVSPWALACLERFGYARAGRPCVPIYVWAEDRPVLEALFLLVRLAADALVREALTDLRSCAGLTANRHRVAVAETANEVYHLLFGQVNECLVRDGLVEAPEDHGPQGRYRRAFEIHQGTVARPCPPRGEWTRAGETKERSL